LTLYEDLGFHFIRRLLIMERQPEAAALIAGYQIDECDPMAALNHYDTFHDVDNPWQRSHHALVNMAVNMTGWRVTRQGAPNRTLGYSIGWVGYDRINFMDVATDPTEEKRGEIGAALLRGIHYQAPFATGQLFNLGENDAITQPAQDMGYKETLAQHEMKIEF
jgi:hypothetical protein